MELIEKFISAPSTSLEEDPGLITFIGYSDSVTLSLHMRLRNYHYILMSLFGVVRFKVGAVYLSRREDIGRSTVECTGECEVRVPVSP